MLAGVVVLISISGALGVWASMVPSIFHYRFASNVTNRNDAMLPAMFTANSA